MTYQDLAVLIPGHSLEDFPADLGETDASSLLNSFAAAWHPALLAAIRELPRWHRADDPPDATQKRLIFLPAPCESWISADWTERIAAEGSVIIRGLSERGECVAKALEAVQSPGCDIDLAADFMALGVCHLQVELLTRKMRHFSSLDEVRLQREAVAAADAALVGDADTARTRLKSCFDVLTESRERFYPVECYLLDLCLLIPRLADEHLHRLLQARKPVSVLASARDLAEIAANKTQAYAALREAWGQGMADVVCGDLCEAPLPLMPLNSVIWQLEESQRSIERLFHKRSAVWGRRRYGVFPQLPQLLRKAGFAGALHTVFDDGIYPDAEHSKFRWEGTDGTSIDALSRIPLAADAATSFLRFADRMSESMDNDHVAAVIFARWPQIKSPFFEDLERIARYAPVLGRFVTLSDFFTNTDHPTRHARHKPNEYLAPYLFQAVARDEPDPVSRYATLSARRQKLDVGIWLRSMDDLLIGRSPNADGWSALERSVEEAGDQAAGDSTENIETQLESFVNDAAGALAGDILAGADERAGYLIINPLGFRRIVSVEFDRDSLLPRPSGEQSWIQRNADCAYLTVDGPGAGFVWVPSGSAVPDTTASDFPPLAEANLLRNELFEVHLNAATGGIARIKGHGRSPNRLSQQLNYRFSRERVVAADDIGRADDGKSYYGEMRGTTSTVTSTGPAMGEIVTTGDIVDQTNSRRLAGFTQTIRVWRGRPVVEIDAELAIDHVPDAEPWFSYYAARFAWHDETASITRSAMLGAHEVSGERFESPHYIELAIPGQRTTIIAPGLPFHRKTGPRMIDTILVVPREGRRRFRFVIAVDRDFPLQAALDAEVPVTMLPVTKGPPRAGAAGWFFHLSARNVQMLALLPLVAEPGNADVPLQVGDPPRAEVESGCAVRLIETEGRPVRARLRCFRTPAYRARHRDFRGQTLNVLSIEGDAVLVDLSAHEIADVELHFEAR